MYKVIYLSLALCFTLGFLGCEAPENKSLEPEPDLPLALLTEDSLRSQAEAEGVNPDWYSTVTKKIAASEYFVRYQDRVGAFQSPNRAQNLRVSYFSDGYSVTPRVQDKGNWEAEIMLQEIVRENPEQSLTPVENAMITTDENSLVADHGDFSIEYANSESGMRQNFRIQERLDGKGALKVNLKIDGDLRPIQKGDDAILLAEKHPTRGNWEGKMWYKDLKVFDAEGTQLEARMELDENMLALVVQDEGAVYPILVDPLSTTADWDELGGQLEAQFGYGIAAVARVSKDPVSSVIVSAWNFDNGQVDEGRVYVYYGSSTGLSATPDWQVESDQANALMGRSVSSAGDIDNDGYGDILIGCELCGPNFEGQAFIWKGSSLGVNGGVNGVISPLISANDDWRATGNAGSSFGFSVACAGETNGDGLSDVIIGAPYDGNGQANEGIAYLYTNLTVDGTTSNEAWKAESNDANANFGHSVSSAGDVNGDGTLDIIIGSPNYTNGDINEGAVFLWYGNNLAVDGNPTNEDWFAESDESSSFFGEVATTAGDVNGDGYADVIIGSRRYTVNDLGAVFVWYGSATGLGVNGNPTNEDWYAEGNSNSFFGNSAACAGDVNGDGYSDIIVGAYSYDNGQGNEGGAFVWYGGDGGLGANGTIGSSGNMDWSQESNQTGAGFGWRVASAGDINGDGFSDVLVGAPWFTNTANQEGRTYVYHGSADGLGESPDWTHDSNSGTAQYGYTVSSAGDVNADGFNDVVIGAPYYDGGQTDEGMVQVYHGSNAGLPVSWNWWKESNVSNSRFGYSVSCAGDNNGDGYSDVIIGSPFHSGGGTARGKAEIFRGSATTLASTSIWSAVGENNHDHFGHAVSGLGDIGEDGFSDVIVGAPLFDGATSNEGRVYVYYSDHCAHPYAAANWTAMNDEENSQFGFSVSAGGRVEDGGAGSILVGAPFLNNGSSNEGGAYLWMGDGLPANGTGANADFVAESNTVNGYMGVSVACAGDVNGDSYDDIIIGVDGYTNTLAQEGAAFLWEGSNTGLSTTAGTPLNADWSVFGNLAGAFYGFSVSGAGDVNGDGYDDVIIGAPFWESGSGDNNEGKAYLYQGSNTGLSTTADWEYESDVANSWFGWAVSSAGDLNGDGYDDVIIGAPKFNNNVGTPNEGQAYVFQGNSGGGLRSNTRQFQFASSTVVAPGCLTDSDEEVRLAQFATHFLGRQDGQLVTQIEEEGSPFSCGAAPLTNCTAIGVLTGFTDLGVSGSQLTSDISGSILDNVVYEWRSRITYNLTTAITGQLAGPWRYQPNEHIHGGGFRAMVTPSTASCKHGGSTLEEEALAAKEATQFSIYPSPIRSGQILKVDMVMNQESKVKIRIANSAGQILRQETTSLNAGTNHLELDTGIWPAGIYMIQLEGNGLQINRKFVIQ